MLVASDVVKLQRLLMYCKVALSASIKGVDTTSVNLCGIPCDI